MTFTHRQYAISLLLVMLLPCLGLAPVACGVRVEERSPDEAREREMAQSLEFLASRDAPVYGYEVIATYAHDSGDFTQGLDLDGGILYEGTGRKGRSRLLKTDLATGAILDTLSLAPEYFGEGVTVLGDEVFQLTYTSNLGFVYDKHSLGLKRTFAYATEGWGLTHDGDSLIMSDGTDVLYFLDPAGGSERGRIGVRDNLGAVTLINELEYMDGEIYANIWQTSLIAIISPLTGEVSGWIDLAGLNPDPENLVSPYVLNGIACDAETGHLLVTGKCWPHIYEISISSRPD
ncbi:MAG: glutaminyl-peptide cyclotransferase [Actinobacteria bacterium]|nr:glutaminyl-peptide cyclotransferase [Actinomycetota bacterium]